jgi:hypothetical protein
MNLDVPDTEKCRVDPETKGLMRGLNQYFQNTETEN